ncbi:hypothetical protein E4U32_001976 [Claviceps aff. humidiphila group G2b]|nr:hypothetical protein E4U32_001976 [Claviceps aff. humidiphila group G2b]
MSGPTLSLVQRFPKRDIFTPWQRLNSLMHMNQEAVGKFKARLQEPLVGNIGQIRTQTRDLSLGSHISINSIVLMSEASRGAAQPPRNGKAGEHQMLKHGFSYCVYSMQSFLFFTVL